MPTIPRETAIGVAAATALAVAGGAGALFLILESGASADDSPTPEPAVVLEYVDEFGNPAPAPGDTPAAAGTRVSSETESIVVVVDAATGAPLPASVQPSGAGAVDGHDTGSPGHTTTAAPSPEQTGDGDGGEPYHDDESDGPEHHDDDDHADQDDEDDD